MLRDVKHIVSDGLLGFGGTLGTGIQVKIGASPVTATKPITILGTMNATRIRGLLGDSPLADAAMDAAENGAGRTYCIPVAPSTPGTVDEVKKTGTGTGTMTVTGTPTNAFALVVRITAPGTLNTAAYTVSINGGHTVSDEATIPTGGQCQLSGTGLTLAFAPAATGEAEKSFAVGDSYTLKTTAPAMTNADVLTALEQLRTFEAVWELVHVVGSATPALWAAVAQVQEELQSQYKRPMIFLLEAQPPNAEEGILDYALRLETARKLVHNYAIQVVPARGLYTRMDGSVVDINLAGVVSGLYARVAPHTSIGKTSPTAALGIAKSKLLELRPAGVEEILELLDLAGYLTFRGYDGLEHYFVYHPLMLSPTGSDFRYAEDVRVLHKILRETRREGLLLLGEDIDLTDIQGELEKMARFLQVPLDKMVEAGELSSIAVTPTQGQEESFLTDETARFQIRYLSRGYVREIIIDVGRSAPDTE